MSYRRAASQVRRALLANPACVVELLENRQLLSASLVRGVLRVDGGTASDTIRILDADHRRGRLVVEVNGQKSVFPSKSVKQIDVGGKRGVDKVSAKFAAGQVRGRTLRVLNPKAQLQVSGDRASLAGMHVKVGSASSVFSAKAGTWVATSATPVRWSAVQVASTSNTITSVLASAVMSTAVATAPAQSIWPATTVPGVQAVADDSTIVQLGLKFQANVSGSITGIRFFKGTTNTGTHTGQLWTSDGKRLAQVTFTNETASGWQQALFSTPVHIDPATTYIASYVAPNGCYADDKMYFKRGSYSSGNLTALDSVYVYANGTQYPTLNWKDSNYYVDVVFTPDLPAAPSGLTATPVALGQINLAWADNSTDETAFKIERRIGVDGAWAQIATIGPDQTTFADTMVAPGYQYFYRVDATSAVGDSAYSNEASAITSSGATSVVPVAPAAPSNLVAAAVSSGRIDLSWTDNSTNEDGFKIERSTGLAGTWSTLATTGANVVSFADTSVAPATQYFYRVSATNTAGSSAATAAASATTLATLPAAPSGLIASGVSSSGINLKWTDNSTNETAFAVESKLSTDTAWSRLVTLGANATSYSVGGLAEAKAYSFRVLAVNSAGESAGLPVGATTLPASPSALYGTAVSTSQINLSWADNSSGETGYRIDRKTGSAGTWSTIANLPANAISFNNTGLSASTQYYYRVAAVGAGGTSLFSAEAAATTLTPLPAVPAAPTALAVSDTHSTLVGLAWTDNATNETGYAVDRKLAGGTTWSRIATLAANVTSYSDSSVLEATSYSYRVLAVNTGGESASSAISVTTLPNAPTGLAISNVKSTQLDLNWTDNSARESGYVIERKTGAAGTFAQIATVGPNVTTYSDSNLAEATEYVYRVRAYVAPAVFSGYAGEVSATTPLPMAAPGNLAATVMSGVEVDLKWADNSGDETGFKIERSANGTNFQQIGTVAANATSYADTTVSGGTRYWYRVRAAGTGGDSAYSTQTDVTTALVLVPGTGWTGPTTQPDPVGTPDQAGYNEKAIARWDVVPYQTFDGAFNVGVVAFHMNDIDHVSFSVNGGAWSDVYAMTLNPQTGNHSDVGVQSDGVVEYWATLRASDFQDGQVEVRAIAYPKVGVPRVLQGIALSANSAYSLRTLTRYVSPVGDDTTGDGTEVRPFRTIFRAAQSISTAGGSNADGGVIYLKAGDYTFDRPNGSQEPYTFNRWMTIRPAAGVQRADVHIVESAAPNGGMYTKLVHLQDVTVKTTIASNGPLQDYLWLDQCDLIGGGRTWNVDWHGGWSGVFVTDVSIADAVNGVLGATIQRNVRVSNIGSDAFSDSLAIINCVADHIDNSGTTYHPDVVQYYGVSSNLVVYGLTATNSINAQGLFAAPASNAIQDVAYVDCDVTTQGDAIAFQVLVPTRHMYLKDSRISGPAQWRTDKGFTAVDVVVEYTSFTDPPGPVAGVVYR